MVCARAAAGSGIVVESDTGDDEHLVTKLATASAKAASFQILYRRAHRCC